MENLKKELEPDGYVNLTMEVDGYECQYGGSVFIILRGDRPETKEEAARRIANSNAKRDGRKRLKEEEEVAQRALYEKLRKKYGD